MSQVLLVNSVLSQRCCCMQKKIFWNPFTSVSILRILRLRISNHYYCATKSEPRFCTCSNPVSVCRRFAILRISKNGSRPRIRLKPFRWSTIPQKQSKICPLQSWFSILQNSYLIVEIIKKHSQLLWIISTVYIRYSNISEEPQKSLI